MSTGYTVDLTTFQGPLDLLLQLIEKEELDITKIALAQVTDQYLAHIRQMSRRDPADLSAFLLIAARLLLIKSQVLLPKAPMAALEEEEGDDLVRQLEEYRRYKEAAQQMKSWLEEGRRGFGRLAAPPLPRSQPDELEGATLDALLDALQRRIEELRPEQRQHPLTVPRKITLADRARHVYRLLRERTQVHFHDILEEAPGIEEIVVTLWAVLELIKRHWIVVEQEELFGTIIIRRCDDTAAEWDGRDAWWTQLEDLD